MCGICGIVSFCQDFPVSEELVQKMCAEIRHRGPDDHGFYVNQIVGLGMRRLSIIDIQGGHQPIYNEDKTICVVFNGEIYNYQALKKELEQCGHHFCTRSDTEAIVHAYEEWGDEIPKKLRGMFVFAIWDSVKRRLFIARDRLGKKPLYYYHDGRQFIFASEIKSLLQCAAIPRRLNLLALDAYLSLGYVPAPDTMFSGVHKLPAGHSLSILENHLSIQEYWDITYKNEYPRDLTEYREQLTSLLEEAVRIRLMSEVPLGAFLSGGIDSSLVVALMSRFMERPVDTFSVGFEDKDLDELPFARLASHFLSTNHHEIILNSCTPSLIEKLVWHMDEPIADPAAVPTLLLSELARQHVTVVLTGEGGDELFAGYSYYRAEGPSRWRQLVPSTIGRRILPAAALGINTLLGRQRYHERTIWHWSLPAEQQMIAWIAVFTDKQKEAICDRALQHCLSAGKAAEIMARFYRRCQTDDDLHRLMYVDTKLWLPDDLLMKVDKMTMAHSIEARAPFLDHHLVEYAATIPAALKVNGKTSKFILKEVAKTMMPEGIIDRPKHTFDVPIGKWLTTSLRETTLDILSDGVIGRTQFFNRGYLRGELWRGLEADQSGCARQVWSLVVLGLWARLYKVGLA